MSTDILTTYLSKYIQDSKQNVYKVMPTHLLQLSPWDNGDRRVYEFDSEDFTVLTYKNACMIVNKQFSETDEEWEFKGKHYIARKKTETSPDEQAAMMSMLPSHKVLKKTEKLLDELGDEQTISISDTDGLSELKLVRHKGKIYYMLIVADSMPRVKMYDMFGQFCSWAHIKNVKPIFCLEDKKFI